MPVHYVEQLLVATDAETDKGLTLTRVRGAHKT